MYGKFKPDTAGYEITTLNLPASWEYVYENRDVLLKVDQFGPVYAQAHPPGDIMLFKRENHEKYSPWMIRLDSPVFDASITNFFRPNALETGAEPEEVSIEYLPECAKYHFEYRGLAVSTEYIIPNSGTAIAMKFRIRNLSQEQVEVKVRPQFIPYLNEASMAPWDKFEWYLDSTCGKEKLLAGKELSEGAGCPAEGGQEEYLVFTTKLLSADALSEKRRCAYFVTPTAGLAAHELSLEKFLGQGDVTRPEGNYTNDTRIYGYPPVYASAYDWTLGAGEEKELVQVLTLEELSDAEQFFDPAGYEQIRQERKAYFTKLLSRNHIQTGDEAFDDYVNHWLPLQMNWVASLDRGWPTGMRGSRDSAQDYAALLYSDTENCRKILLTMLECQRSDGWFPRQYSAKGRLGKHDLRTHVDGGAFFVEYLWKYLAHTQDFEVLQEPVSWLDREEKSTVLEHLTAAVTYYLQPENVGEHGLCKIRGGDWLDAVNAAGLEGRGESVTVSEQTVMSLKYLADILRKIGKEDQAPEYLERAEELKKQINAHARNQAGYYNGVFNDNGQWIFSEKDPDGQARIYGVSNYYAIISGVAEGEKIAEVLNACEKLKCDKGYRLFYPCLGETPIDKVGRIASGDVPPYLGENGNVYNHGSQGFFARALSVAGEGDRLFEMLKWIMPYDTGKHPTELAWTPPYAIVNCWQELPEFNHRGLMCFLTGSVAMAMRGVYEWMLGIKPCLDGLEIDPCLPKGMPAAEVTFEYLHKPCALKIEGRKILLNGRPVTGRRKNIITGKEVYFVPIPGKMQEED